MDSNHSSPADQPIHPFPMEALNGGLWWGVKKVSIQQGRIMADFEDESLQSKQVCVKKLRWRPRKALVSDCGSTLRPGVEVSVFLSTPPDGISVGNSSMAWYDATLTYIKKKPHWRRCTCSFIVTYFQKHDHPMSMTCSEKNTAEISIDHIRVLQRLRTTGKRSNFQNGVFEDVPLLKRGKLSNGNWKMEFPWLVVISALRGMNFDLKLNHNKLEYLISNNSERSCDAGNVRAVSFYQSDKRLKPNLEIFSHDILEEKAMVQTEAICINETISNEACTTTDIICLDDWDYDIVHLRRSRRQRNIPDWFSGHSEDKGGNIQSKKKIKHSETLGNGIYPKSVTWAEDIGLDYEDSLTMIDEKANQESCSENIFVKIRDHKAITEDPCVPTHGSHVPLLECFPGSDASDKGHEFNPRVSNFEVIEGNAKPTVGNHRTDGLLNHHKTVKTNAVAGKYTNAEFDMRDSFPGVTSCTLGKKKVKKNRTNVKPYNLIYREDHSIRRMTNNEILLEYKKRLEDFVHNATSHASASVVAPPNSVMEENYVFRWPSPPTEVESSDPPEIACLWEELDQIYSEVPFPPFSEESNFKLSDNVGEIFPEACQHQYVLEEEIGVTCQLCKIVSMDIRYVLPPLNPLWDQHKEPIDEMSKMKINKSHNAPHGKSYEKADFSMMADISDSSENVWSLIADLKSKLHSHQQKAFEFIWKNVAGSAVIREMDPGSDVTGGCIISHSPGTGKTLLVIAFLKSYLRLFPRCKPLILVPKVTLYTWAKEFEKWEPSIPVYEILATDDYKNMNSDDVKACCRLLGQMKPPVHMMRIVDCLQKLQMWHEKPSILLTSYSCFSSFTNARTDSELNEYIAEILLNSPGIIVLDEGHMPRSTNSILRQTLMDAATDLRILMSGTLFQNNFEEYFNTLCLARPAFIQGVLNEFKATRMIQKHHNMQNSGRTRVLAKEKIARSIFMEEVASLINSEEEDVRKYGLDKLRMMTGSFIDVYEGTLLEKLPGLQTYTILIKPTPLQQKILCKLEALDKKHCLEIESIITATAIHAWLAKTLGNVDQFLSKSDLDIDKYRTDITHGSKIQFIVDLVRHCIRQKEKVLIFCRYIPPLDLLVDIFLKIFQWQKGREVLFLQGKQDTLDRSLIMDKFNDPRGCAQVLLASTTACSEGINLTGASRLVLLDSEWNPSKTKQAIARAFRLGQEKIVYVYRLLALGTLEQEKLERTSWKEQLSRMVFRCEDTRGGSSFRQTEHIADDMLRLLVENDHTKMFHSIMKHDDLVKSTDQVTL